MSKKLQPEHATLDEIIAEIRQEGVDEAMVEQAAKRVWGRLNEHPPTSEMATGATVEKIRGCDDFRALLPAYLKGDTSPARSLLLEDHLHACVACRHVLAEARLAAKGAPRRSELIPAWLERPRRPVWALGWAWAAAVIVLGLGFLLGSGSLIRVLRGSEVQASLQTVDGTLYHVTDQGETAVPPDGAIRQDEEVRTAKASSAVLRLMDGSTVEMNERTALWVSRGWRDTTLHLQRGTIIVRAAHQNHGRLQVATRDCLVSVKGTIFAVDEGMKGARVSVIQGVVEVEQGRKTRYLHAGEQAATEASLRPVPVTHEVAWSRDAGEYLALLGEFAALHKQFQALPGPAPRYDSALLNLVPEDTVLYAAIPNMGATLGEANRLLQDRIQQSEVLQAWWNRQQASGEARKQTELMERVQAFSGYLGDEIVVALEPEKHSPLILAEVRRSDFRPFLQEQIKQMQAGGKKASALIVDNPLAALSAPPDTALIMVKNNLVAVAGNPAQMRTAATLMERAAPSGFATTPFYAAIRQAYQGGAGLLICADLEQILAHSVNKKESGEFNLVRDQSTGLADMRYLIMESKDVSGRSETRATLSFAQQRHGITAWLASPSPMGSMDFVTPDAGFAISLVVGDPRTIAQEIFSLAGSHDAGFSQNLAEFESKTGVNVSDDLAGALGGEATFALDGPILPTPSWKVALEVNDPSGLQGTVEKLVASYNQEAAPGSGSLALTSQADGGRTYYTLEIQRPSTSKGGLTEVYYVFVDGYLLAASSRALLMSSIESRSVGYALARSADFTALLPSDKFTNCSALMYQNLGAALASASSILEASPMLTPAQRQSIETLQKNSAPSLTCAYGEPQDIVIASSGGFFGLGFDSVLGIRQPGVMDLLPMIEKAARSNAQNQ